MSVYNNIRDRYYIYRIRKDSDFFRRISAPSFNLIKFLMKFDASLIKHNHTISHDVMELMVNKDYNSIRYFHNPDKRLVWQAARKNPEILKSLDLNNEQQMYVYEQNCKTFDYIMNPTDTLQKTAVLDNWNKALSIKGLSPAACDAFLSSAFNVYRQLTPELQDAVTKLVSEWKDIDREYHGVVEMTPESKSMYRNLAQNGIERVPDYLKKDICHARYKNSIIEFQHSTGLQLSDIALAFQSTLPSDTIRTRALLEGIHESSSTQVKSLEDIYCSCAENIIKKKNQIENCASLTKEQLNSVLGNENADKLVSVLNDNGKTLSDMSGKDLVNLVNKGETTMANGSVLKKVSGPAGYAMQAYQYMESMSSLGQCEM